ncbi:acyltransferase domain-containing protein [Streptomyces sp. SM1P]
MVTAEDPVAGLEAFLSGAPAGEAYTTGVADGVRDPAPVFLFSGQGGGHPGMGAELAARFPVVAEVLESCARVYAEETGRDDFLDRIVGGQGPARWDTAFAQPALFALQLAQARLWERLGVTPARVAGHSVGAYAALCVAGALDTEDAMRLVCGRGRLMQERSAPGAMVSVFVPRARARELLAAVPGLELAVVNGTTHHVLGGPRRRWTRCGRCWRRAVRRTKCWRWTGRSTRRCSIRRWRSSASWPTRRNRARCTRSSSTASTARSAPPGGGRTPRIWSRRPAVRPTSPPCSGSWPPRRCCWSWGRPPC